MERDKIHDVQVNNISNNEAVGGKSNSESPSKRTTNNRAKAKVPRPPKCVCPRKVLNSKPSWKGKGAALTYSPSCRAYSLISRMSNTRRPLLDKICGTYDFTSLAVSG